MSGEEHLESVQRSLREMDERFRLLVESAKDYAIFILDPKGHVTTWNAGAERIKGYRADEIIGKHFSIFYPPEDVAAGKCELELVVAETEGRFEEEGLRVRKDGTTFWASVIISPLRDTSGKQIGFAKVTRDLSDKKRADDDRIRLAEVTAGRAEAERALATLLQLQALGVALSGLESPQAIMDTAVQKGGEVLSTEASALIRLDGESVVVVSFVGLTDDVRGKYQRYPATTKIIASRALVTGEPEWVETRADFAREYPDSPFSGIAGAACALPLVAGGRTIGAMVYRFKEQRTFSPSERAFLLTFAGQAAQSLERAEAHARANEARRRLEVLSELAQALSTALTTADVAKAIVQRGRESNGADTCTLYRFEPSIPALVLLDERGCNPEILAQIRVVTADSESALWRALSTGESVWIENDRDYAAAYPRLAKISASATTQTRARAFWAMPLVTEGMPIGLLAMGFHEERTFSADERAFIATFTRQCSDALLRARRLEDEGHARHAAETARASLATTLRSIGDAVIATDKTGLITMMNPIAEQLTGWTEDDAKGRPLSEIFVIVNEQTRLPVVSPVDKVLELGTIVGLANHTILIAKDGRETPIDDSGAPIRGGDGATEGVVLVFRNVAEKKRDESRRELLEKAGVVLNESLEYEVTLAKVARLAVPKFADWVGVDLVDDGMKPKQVAVAHVDPAKVEFAREFGRRYPPSPDSQGGVPHVLRTGKSVMYADVTDAMIRASARDEEHLEMSLALHIRSVLIVPLLAHDRTIGAMSFVWAESEQRYDESDLAFAEELAARCAHAIDNARLYDAEQQARSAADVANRAKDEFLATVSHELRTPLNAIMGWAKLLTSKTLDESKQDRAVATIDRNAVAMAQLIEDLLDISRIISGKMRLEIQMVHLGRVIEAAIDSVRPAADAKAIVIEERTDVEALSTTGDPARLQQVVWNLLSNAVKFTPRGGKIDVELVREKDGIEITVTDTGKGIDPRFLPHVFDAFRQEDASHTRSRGGLGLGLAITRQLVELHGGNVTVQSEGGGKGAVFRVHLPAAPSATTQLNRTGRVRKFRLDSVFEALPQLNGIHVLVVDDEDDARDLLKTVLEEVGARVTLAASADEALQALIASTPNVLISDIGMPLRDGYDLIRAVRALPPEQGGNVQAAALTAYARAEDRRRAIDAGFSMHIPKPIDPAELVAVVASLTRVGRS